jgi:hypothetical protein
MPPDAPDFAGVVEAEEVMRTNHRNEHGVKYSADLYRTINGVEYVCWMSFPSEDRIKAYRAAGIRCRRQKEELFVHHMDADDAARIDAELKDATDD